jgi:3'(2'), 5'-bisphosphate nucleotidase
MAPNGNSAQIDDHAVAGLLAREAGDLLLDLRGRSLAEGVSGWRLQSLGDRAAHDHLVGRLTELRPDDAVLSEEGADDRSRLGAERTWIIDPLDGTQDYPRVGSTEWAVHVALVIDGRPVAAAVSVPANGGLYGTLQSPLSTPIHRERPIVVTSRSQWGHAEDVATALGGEVHAFGSAGAKAMAVVSGAADVYVHPSGLYEWDVCAPAAVAAAAGLDVTGVDGSELVYNKARPVVPGLLVSRPEYTERARAALRW